MISVILFQGFITLLFALGIGYYIALHQAYSFIMGALVILLSFGLLGWAWGLIFKKKLVALAIGIIVFKYAILGIIIFRLVDQPWFKPLWFALGVGSFTFSAVFYAVKEALREGKEDGI